MIAKLIASLGNLVVITLLFWLGINYRNPFFLKIRVLLPFILLITGILFSGYHFRKRIPGSKQRLIYHSALSFFFILTTTLPFFQMFNFLEMKKEILNTNPNLLQKLGAHFIVGYTDFNQIRVLVAKGAIGGVFITQRNIVGKTKSQIKREIAELQQLQKSQGFPPLFIATDQEGGIVSRLTPLVRKLPPLADIKKDLAHIKEYAKIQAEDLAYLGVNVNFSPVVDLKPKVKMKGIDLHSQIKKRAIAADPKIVTYVAKQYSRTLYQHGIFPTLKHFPGLAHVNTDTHFETGAINKSVEYLSSQDWMPFQNIINETQAFIMLGHVKVLEIDSQYPASLSKKLIQKVLRKDWKFEGILITDDFTMGPIYRQQRPIGAATARALNAGVDLILFAYDGELYYEAMKGLLQNHKSQKLKNGVLQQSYLRIAKAKHYLNKQTESICYGTRRNGAIEHAWSLPIEGQNFTSYSKLGTWLGRTYVHSRIHRTLLQTYQALQNNLPKVRWVYGETASRNGGKFWPHITHQNGLSVDHMVPVKDSIGNIATLPLEPANKFGYDIEFDSDGKYQSYAIDFEAMGEFLYQLDKAAKSEGISIRQVIFNPSLRQNLMTTKRWKYLAKHIKFSKYPTQVRHDEHFHIDFKIPCKPLKSWPVLPKQNKA